MLADFGHLRQSLQRQHIIGIARGGRFVALEVKSETGRVTKEQATFIALVRHMGGVGEVVRSVEEAMAAVDRAVKGGDL